jgi:DNA polymerase III subunit delta
MPSWKPAYLVHGDDHGRIAERRARLRALAEAESGTGGVEVFEGDTCTAETVAGALSAMTFAVGRRFVIADGVERWKDADVETVAPLLASLPPDTTVAFFAREEGRSLVPKALHKAVEKAGGSVAAETTVKPWELPKWVAEQARRAGLELDKGAASALVHRVGDRQQRLLREVERLALELGPGATLTADDVEAIAASSAERKVWSLADALVARDARTAVTRFLELREQGERLPGLLYWMTTRLRLAHEVVTRLEVGESTAAVKKGLRMPPKAASEFVAHAQRSDAEHLREAIARLADLELDTRGGGTLSEDTAALRTIATIAA